MNNKMLNKQNTKGVTIIALTVTIIVLLILASVSITVVLGNNGVIDAAKNSEKRTNQVMNNKLNDINDLKNQLNDTMNP